MKKFLRYRNVCGNDCHKMDVHNIIENAVRLCVTREITKTAQECVDLYISEIIIAKKWRNGKMNNLNYRQRDPRRDQLLSNRKLKFRSVIENGNWYITCGFMLMENNKWDKNKNQLDAVHNQWQL